MRWDGMRARRCVVLYCFDFTKYHTRRRVFFGRVPPRVARFRDRLHLRHLRIFVTRSLGPRAFRAVFPFPRQSRPMPPAEHVVHHLRRGVLHSGLVLLEDGEVGDVRFGERAKTSSKTSSITPVAPGTRRSRSGRRGSSNPRRTRTRTAVCRHASTRTPRRHPRGSCSARPDASEKVRRRDGEGKIFSAVSPLARVSFARVGFVERYVSGYNTLRTRHLVICSSISSSVFPLVSTTVR
jgi:hypothetical protein